MAVEALPQGCSHIGWTWVPALNDAGEPNGDQRAEQQFATWLCPADDESAWRAAAEELIDPVLRFTGEPHLCQTDGDTGYQLWAVAVEPAA